MNLILTQEFVCFVITHKDSGDAAESWRSTVGAEAVLRLLNETPDWDPLILEIIEQTPKDSVVDWKLLWRNPQPKWASDGNRVVQLGDRAHSFLPTSGNGATQAMEDALSLATCLRLGGRDKVVQSVKSHVLMRYALVVTTATGIPSSNTISIDLSEYLLCSEWALPIAKRFTRLTWIISDGILRK